MELTTILKRCRHCRGFVYEHARFSTDKMSIEVVLQPRKGSAFAGARIRPAERPSHLRLLLPGEKSSEA
jgi:hypothetical protein